jgi:hypothetical protein
MRLYLGFLVIAKLREASRLQRIIEYEAEQVTSLPFGADS